MNESKPFPKLLVVGSILVFLGILTYGMGRKDLKNENIPLPHSSGNGVALGVLWGDLGSRMVAEGVIDQQKFENLYQTRGGLSEGDLRLLTSSDNGEIILTRQNSGLWLNLFWALGLGNQNAILEKGPMQDLRYGGAGGFASTGGWSLARGNPMEHYSHHPFIPLSPEQQDMVARVSRSIFRPCCDNPTHFPDCNHGMAMLGFLELAANQGKSEEELYRLAYALNSYWFPEQYSNIERYFSQQGISASRINPAEALGSKYSSGSGYQAVLSQIVEPSPRSSSSCGA